MVISCPTVTTPVPPTPPTNTSYEPASSGKAGSGISASLPVSTEPVSMPRDLRSCPPSIVTKLGQKPFTQEKSLLQEDWSILRLRPNSVWRGTTERQFD